MKDLCVQRAFLESSEVTAYCAIRDTRCNAKQDEAGTNDEAASVTAHALLPRDSGTHTSVWSVNFARSKYHHEAAQPLQEAMRCNCLASLLSPWCSMALSSLCPGNTSELDVHSGASPDRNTPESGVFFGVHSLGLRHRHEQLPQLVVVAGSSWLTYRHWKERGLVSQWYVQAALVALNRYQGAYRPGLSGHPNPDDHCLAIPSVQRLFADRITLA